MIVAPRIITWMGRSDLLGTAPWHQPLASCVCGECIYCPDGWHRGDEECDCTAWCVLGDVECQACGYHSVPDDEGALMTFCLVCDTAHVRDGEGQLHVFVPHRIESIIPNPNYL